MKLTMVDITSHLNNWDGRLQIQLAPLISAEFFSFPYKFETTAEIRIFCLHTVILIFTWLKFQMLILISIIYYFESTTAQALFNDSLNSYGTDRVYGILYGILYTPHGTIWQCTAKRLILAFTKGMGWNWHTEWIPGALHIPSVVLKCQFPVHFR